MTKTAPRELVLCIAAAVAVRLAMMWFVELEPVQNDGAGYDFTAMNLVDHGVLSTSQSPPYEPTTYRPPLYPAFLASIYSVAGHSRTTARLIQIVVSIVALLLAASLAETQEQGTGRWVRWALALCPFDAIYSVAILSEGLCTFLLVCAFAAWWRFQGNGRWVGLGLFLGIVTLCRDIYIVLAPFVAFAWFVAGDGLRSRRLREGVLVVAVSLAVVAPWTVRNYQVTGRVIPVSAGRLGLSLWLGGWSTTAASIGSESDEHGRIFPPDAYLRPAERTEIAAAAADGDPGRLDRTYRDLFFDRLLAEPHRVIGRWLLRAPLLWFGTRFDIFDLNSSVFPRRSIPWTVAKLLLFGLNAAYVLAALAGTLLAVRRRHPLRWMALPLVVTALVYLPLNSFENRYSQPVYPFLVLTGVIAMRALAARLAHRSAPSSGPDEIRPSPASADSPPTATGPTHG